MSIHLLKYRKTRFVQCNLENKNSPKHDRFTAVLFPRLIWDLFINHVWYIGYIENTYMVLTYVKKYLTRLKN